MSRKQPPERRKLSSRGNPACAGTKGRMRGAIAADAGKPAAGPIATVGRGCPRPSVVGPDPADPPPVRRGLMTPPNPRTEGLLGRQAPSEEGDLRSVPWRGRETRANRDRARQAPPRPEIAPFSGPLPTSASKRPRPWSTPTASASSTATSSRPTCCVDVRGNLWVTDFGLARFGDDASLTMTGDLLGTLRYMSPEQALGHPAVIDQRSDVYGLGVTLYELLTLQPAFDGRDRQEILRQIAFEEPRPPRKLNPAVPRELETIVLKAMAKEPASRYATAQELADDLRRFLEHRPISSPAADRLATSHQMGTASPFAAELDRGRAGTDRGAALHRHRPDRTGASNDQGGARPSPATRTRGRTLAPAIGTERGHAHAARS